MFVPHVPQMWYKCGTQMRSHTFFRSQSSILGSQSSLYPKSGVLLSLYPKYPKWGTSGVHKRGLTRDLKWPRPPQAAPHQADQKIGRSWMLATGLEGLKFVPQKWGTFMFVPQVPQMGYKWGTQKGPHTFFRRFGYYALYALWWPLTTSSDLKWPLVTSKGQLHPKPIWIQHTYL